MSGELTISAGISAYEISGCTTLLSGPNDSDYGHRCNISLIIGASMSTSSGVVGSSAEISAGFTLCFAAGGYIPLQRPQIPVLRLPSHLVKEVGLVLAP